MAVDAARAILAETGHGAEREPWVPVGRAAAAAASISSHGHEERHLELRGRSEPIDVLVLHAEAPSTAA